MGYRYQKVHVRYSREIKKVLLPVTRTGLEQRVVGVEYLTADDYIPFPQQATSILTLFT